MFARVACHCFVLSVVLTTGKLWAVEFLAIDSKALGIDSPTPTQSFRIDAISGDGKTIAGTSKLDGFETICAFSDCASFGFLYSKEDQRLLDFPRPPRNGGLIIEKKEDMIDLSYDGQKAVATFGRLQLQSFLTSPTNGNQTTEPIVIGVGASVRAMSSDGSTVLGSNSSGGFVWQESTGVQPLTIPDASFHFRPIDISGDGETFVIRQTTRSSEPSIGTGLHFVPRHYVWNESSGLQELQAFDRDYTDAVHDLSQDGQILVGTSFTNRFGFQTPTVWMDGIPAPLTLPQNYTTGEANAVSADGGMILGSVARAEEIELVFPPPEQREFPRGSRAVLWQRDSVLILQDWLANEWGLADELDGWTLTAATAISADGRTIAGSGVNPEGNLVGWVVTLPVPEPAGAVLMLLLLGGLTLAQRRRRA